MNPTILSRSVLALAIRALARQSPEVAVYFVVVEALTNAVKHSNASEVYVGADFVGGCLQVTIRDDGIGGAAVGGGSGLIGLRERVEVLGG
ncbi:MAG: ATP-binding protein [Mycobacterium sp.]